MGTLTEMQEYVESLERKAFQRALDSQIISEDGKTFRLVPRRPYTRVTLNPVLLPASPQTDLTALPE